MDYLPKHDEALGPSAVDCVGCLVGSLTTPRLEDSCKAWMISCLACLAAKEDK